MCNLSKGIEEKGMAKGLEKGKTEAILASIKALIKKLSISAEEAMSMLDIPDNDRPLYMRLLNNLDKH